MYVYDEQKIEKEKRKRRLFILMNSLMYVIIPIIIGFLKIISNSKELYVNGKKLENTEDVKKWIWDSTNYFEILWDYKRTDNIEEPKIKATLSNEKGQYLVIEKKNYGWSFLKMKENHYYKLGVTYKKDIDRTIEMEKSLGLIPQD